MGKKQLRLCRTSKSCRADIVRSQPDQWKSHRIANNGADCRCKDAGAQQEGKQYGKEEVKTDEWRE